MGAYLSSLPFWQLILLLIIGGGLTISLVAIVGAFWTDIRKREISAALKQDMLSRGMSADEIRIVLDAGTKRSGKIRAESQEVRCS